MDKEEKARAWHEVILTFDILISACIVAGAIVFSAMWEGRRLSGSELKHQEQSARQQFTQQMTAGLKGKPVLNGKEREVRGVRITDLRFSSKQDQMLIEFSLAVNPPPEVTGSVIFLSDGFGRFTGQWGTEDRQFRLLIK